MGLRWHPNFRLGPRQVDQLQQVPSVAGAVVCASGCALEWG